MMEGSQGWWSMNNMRAPQQTFPLLPPSSTTPSTSSSSSFSAFSHQYPLPSSSLPSTSAWHDNQDMQPDSWSQLLLGGVVGEEERCTLTPFPPKMENWIHSTSSNMINVKQEIPDANGTYMHGHYNDEIQHAAVARSKWNNQMMPVSSPKSSCITTLSSNMLDFSNLKGEGRHPKPDHSSECNSSISGSSFKKARVQPSSTPQSTFKVRKEKLGDRITVLHQLVSPFGKTDTASVLLEAIGYIRFLQGQIEALSSPYLGNNAPQPTRQPVQGERSRCIFSGDSGQDGENDDLKKDLRTRGLCLVPISCTMHVGSENGADYWTPASFTGFR